MAASRARLPDGRLHFQHGPIDIVIGADGDARALDAAHAAAWQRFEGVLGELVAELPLLRRPVEGACRLQGPIARRMWHACLPFSAVYITPMAAVAGAVAQELIAFYDAGGIERAWVNDGGDIAWHLAPGRSLRLGLYADLARLDAAELARGIRIDGRIDVTHEMPVRGVATSGWRGRSFSLGIADSVTVLARDAAAADAAATMIANAVNTDDPAIERRPARDLDPDSDLREHRVTVSVGTLDAASCAAALAQGERAARTYRAAGVIEAAYIELQGRRVAAGGTDATAAIPEKRMAWSLHA